MKEKQIEEMARTMCGGANDDCIECNTHCGICEFWTEASILYNAGYRKASDVAREIFAEIEQEICNIEYTVSPYKHTHIPVETMVEVCNWILQKCIPEKIAELKKKYAEGEK